MSEKLREALAWIVCAVLDPIIRWCGVDPETGETTDE